MHKPLALLVLTSCAAVDQPAPCAVGYLPDASGNCWREATTSSAPEQRVELGPWWRPAEALLPAAADEPAPIVLLLGGYDYFSRDLDDWIRLSGLVDSYGFALVLADGTVDRWGSPFWNATDTCCDYAGTEIDDVAWLEGLIEELGARPDVDGDRVYVIGHSNGAFMGYRLACEPDSPVDALVSIAGSGWLNPQDCKATHPISLLQVHGTLDDVMPIGGDADAPGALTMLSRWVDRAGCSGFDNDGVLDMVGGPEDETHVRSAGACPDGLDVRLWAMFGTDHYPDFHKAFPVSAIQWMLAH